MGRVVQHDISHDANVASTRVLLKRDVNDSANLQRKKVSVANLGEAKRNQMLKDHSKHGVTPLTHGVVAC